jgi:hypothetical protein
MKSRRRSLGDKLRLHCLGKDKTDPHGRVSLAGSVIHWGGQVSVSPTGCSSGRQTGDGSVDTAKAWLV